MRRAGIAPVSLPVVARSASIRSERHARWCDNGHERERAKEAGHGHQQPNLVNEHVPHGNKVRCLVPASGRYGSEVTSARLMSRMAALSHLCVMTSSQRLLLYHASSSRDLAGFPIESVHAVSEASAVPLIRGVNISVVRPNFMGMELQGITLLSLRARRPIRAARFR